jgi:hypothetical protein
MIAVMAVSMIMGVTVRVSMTMVIHVDLLAQVLTPSVLNA